MAHRLITESMADNDAEFFHHEDDPWQTVRRMLGVVSLDASGGDVADPNYPNDAEVEAPDPSEAIQLLGNVFETLTEQERSVVAQRVLFGDTYDEVAKKCANRLSVAGRRPGKSNAAHCGNYANDCPRSAAALPRREIGRENDCSRRGGGHRVFGDY